MRALLPLCFVLFAPATQAHEDRHDHDALSPHVHGEAHLDIAQTEQGLELQWHSPAADLVGFEHRPRTPEERQQVERLRQTLAAPTALIKLTDTARCRLAEAQAESPLFTEQKVSTGGHQDVEARQTFVCDSPAALNRLDLSGWFARFPASHSVEVQAVLASGQHGAELTSQQPQFTW